ncbi:MAG TPA: FAD/NAD(P)-binding protein [Woeseiaceae bacterium]|nr:FAD/NAD(P)-binding protein [Woeseiaceae bacterium]
MIRGKSDVLYLRPRLRPLSILERFHVVIVGGGFSGVALAAHLVRHGDRGLRITLVEAGERVGRGIAYGTELDDHLLNTRAADMSALEDEADDFVWWLRRHGHASSGREFVSRRRYGDYLEDKLIETSLRAAQHDIAFSANGGTRVTDVMDGGDAFLVALDDGRSVGCDAVVLATGHASPPDILARWLPRGHARWIRDPWAAPGVGPGGIGRDDRVLMIGSGLTMIDKLLELEACGHTGPVHALSRRGLLPRAHRRRPETLPADVQRALSDGLARAGSLRAMLRVTRRAIAAAEHRGTSWRPVIDALRALAPSLWSRLSPADRRRFLRRLRPYWDVHRHRTAPSIGAVIEARLATGRLEVRAGRVCGAEVRERGIVVEQRLRGATAPRREHYDWIVNCTGHDRPGAGRALEERLSWRGLLLPDLDGLGWIAGPGGALERSDGSPRRLYLLGPGRRPASFESTAVPELRRQAAALAAELVEVAAARRRGPARGAELFRAWQPR